LSLLHCPFIYFIFGYFEFSTIFSNYKFSKKRGRMHDGLIPPISPCPLLEKQLFFSHTIQIPHISLFSYYTDPPTLELAHFPLGLANIKPPHHPTIPGRIQVTCYLQWIGTTSSKVEGATRLEGISGIHEPNVREPSLTLVCKKPGGRALPF
jgi:hypothetical protein